MSAFTTMSTGTGRGYPRGLKRMGFRCVPRWWGIAGLHLTRLTTDRSRAWGQRLPPGTPLMLFKRGSGAVFIPSGNFKNVRDSFELTLYLLCGPRLPLGEQAYWRGRSLEEDKGRTAGDAGTALSGST